jgi:hypothetical protein
MRSAPLPDKPSGRGLFGLPEGSKRQISYGGGLARWQRDGVVDDGATTSADAVAKLDDVIEEMNSLRRLAPDRGA